MATLKSRRVPGDVRLETQSPLTSRQMRKPRHDFIGTMMPMGSLIPCTFAPVLAGDTIKATKIMARVLADMQASSAINWNAVKGHWFESWMFYVRIGDMQNADMIREVLVDPAAASTVNWRDECIEAIWRAYFTDEPVGSTSPVPAYIPFDAGDLCNTKNRLSIPGNGWWDSITRNADLPDVTPAEGDGWQEQWIRYQALRRARLTTSTWEEYLAKSGVSVGPQLRQGDNDPAFRVPELLKWSREFAYPQPAGISQDGYEQFRVQWFIQNSLDRGRFCAEPGFIVTCIAVRPKAYRVYDRDLFDPMDLLNSAEGWLSTDFDTDPHASLVSIPASVIGDLTPGAEATVDVRDLYLYGDQVAVQNEFRAGLSAIDSLFPLTAMDRYPAASVDTAAFAIDMQVSHHIASRISGDTTAG